MNQNISQYISACRAKGMSDEAIKASLLAAGWDMKLVTESLTQPATISPINSPTTHSKTTHLVIGYLLTAVITASIVLGGYVWWSNKNKTVDHSEKTLQPDNAQAPIEAPVEDNNQDATTTSISTKSPQFTDALTYQNEILNFEIKYPPHWHRYEGIGQFAGGYQIGTISPRPATRLIRKELTEDVLEKIKVTPPAINITGPSIDLNVLPIPSQYNSGKQYIDALIQLSIPYALNTVDATSTVTVSGVQMTKVDAHIISGYPQGQLTQSVFLFASDKSYIYIYEYTADISGKDPKDEADFYSIVSSFKMTSPADKKAN